MALRELHLIEQPPAERKLIECVEVYLPKSIEFLSELYQFLREKVTQRLDEIVLDGFSIYEVDGVFRGDRLWEQRTLVIRLLLVRGLEGPADWVSVLINDLGRELAHRVAAHEEQIWICRYAQTLTVFAGLKRVLIQEGQ